MLKQQARLLTTIDMILDLAAVCVSFGVAYHLRLTTVGSARTFHDYLWFFLIVIPVWFVLLHHYGLYASLRIKKVSAVVSQVTKAHLAGAMISSSIVYLVEPHDFGRMLFVYFIVISYIVLVCGKVLLRLLLSTFRSKGYNIRNILVVGGGDKANDFVSILEQHADWGLRVAGIVNGHSPSNRLLDKYRHIGSPEDVVSLCKEQMVDEVVFCLPGSELHNIEEQVLYLNEMGITSRMVIDLVDIPHNRREITMFHDSLPILTFYGKAFDANQMFAKRCLDVIGALIGLLLLALLLPVIALAIRLDSPGPIFFGQERVGENGRRFRCWKFRSMRTDAEELKQELLDRNEMQGQMFKIKDDPRITAVGSFLRKTSLDEFPQFWNVLRGEMSLVGTRPPTPDEVMQYENWHRKRICIKPGITGLWQVSGRNQINDFDRIVRLDIQYIEHWTIWLDIKILFKTIWVVLARQGAS